MASHAQDTQNNKFAISLQYLLKKISEWSWFFACRKHEYFLQIDTMVLDRDDQAFPKFPK